MTVGAHAVYGTKFLDIDANGTRDRGEPGLDGVQIFLDANRNDVLEADDEPATFSDANGEYLLTVDFEPGTDPIAIPCGVVEVPPPWTEPSGELFRDVGFAGLEEIAIGIDFGNFAAAGACGQYGQLYAGRGRHGDDRQHAIAGGPRRRSRAMLTYTIQTNVTQGVLQLAEVGNTRGGPDLYAGSDQQRSASVTRMTATKDVSTASCLMFPMETGG